MKTFDDVIRSIKLFCNQVCEVCGVNSCKYPGNSYHDGSHICKRCAGDED